MLTIKQFDQPSQVSLKLNHNSVVKINFTEALA